MVFNMNSNCAVSRHSGAILASCLISPRYRNQFNVFSFSVPQSIFCECSCDDGSGLLLSNDYVLGENWAL